MASLRGIGVQELIRGEIVAGTLSLGQRLQVDALATRYGVSHMPVREALRELCGEGLVVIEPNRGARVRSVDRSFVENVFDLRNALEALMARRAAERRSDADLVAMRTAADQFVAAVRAEQRQAVLQANRALHDAVYLASGNTEAFEVFKRHWVLVTTLFDSYGFDEDRMQGEIEEHTYIIYAIRQGDGAAAAAVMSTHIERAKQDLLRRMQAALDTPAGRAKAAYPAVVKRCRTGRRRAEIPGIM